MARLTERLAGRGKTYLEEAEDVVGLGCVLARRG